MAVEFEALKVRAADEVQATKEAASVATAALEALKLETEANNLAATAAAAAATAEFEALKASAADEVQAVKEAAAAAAATAELEGIKAQTDAIILATAEAAALATAEVVSFKQKAKADTAAVVGAAITTIGSVGGVSDSAKEAAAPLPVDVVGWVGGQSKTEPYAVVVPAGPKTVSEKGLLLTWFGMFLHVAVNHVVE